MTTTAQPERPHYIERSRDDEWTEYYSRMRITHRSAHITAQDAGIPVIDLRQWTAPGAPEITEPDALQLMYRSWPLEVYGHTVPAQVGMLDCVPLATYIARAARLGVLEYTGDGDAYTR